MSVVTTVLAAPVAGPLRGILALARAIDDRVKQEVYDEDKVRGALAELEIRLDLGEIELEAYEAEEDELLQRLKTIREMKRNGEL